MSNSRTMRTSRNNGSTSNADNTAVAEPGKKKSNPFINIEVHSSDNDKINSTKILRDLY